MSLTRSAYGWVLPRSDKHFAAYLANAPKVEGRRMYQPEHINQAMALCPGRRVAVDVGAHVGFWSYYLALAFDAVHAFEPARLMCLCFEQNVRSKNVVLHRVALGNRSGSVEAAAQRYTRACDQHRRRSVGEPRARSPGHRFSDR
jgi:hypothetical protein